MPAPARRRGAAALAAAGPHPRLRHRRPRQEPAREHGPAPRHRGDRRHAARAARCPAAGRRPHRRHDARAIPVTPPTLEPAAARARRAAAASTCTCTTTSPTTSSGTTSSRSTSRCCPTASARTPGGSRRATTSARRSWPPTAATTPSSAPACLRRRRESTRTSERRRAPPLRDALLRAYRERPHVAGRPGGAPTRAPGDLPRPRAGLCRRAGCGGRAGALHVVILAAAKHPIAEPFAGGLESLTWHLVRGLRAPRRRGDALRRARAATRRSGRPSSTSRRCALSDAARADVVDGAGGVAARAPRLPAGDARAPAAATTSTSCTTTASTTSRSRWPTSLPAPVLTTLHTPPTPGSSPRSRSTRVPDIPA